MAMDVRRHLSFEDLSGSLTRLVTGAEQPDAWQGPPTTAASMQELVAQLASIAHAVQEAHDAMQQRVDEHKRVALEQLDATGGRQALESHLKAQKATWKFIGQKEAFLERVRGLRDCGELLQHDFSSDICTANKAVQTLKEEIRDRNSAIGKTEQQLGSIIQQVTRLYDSGSSAAAQLALQLPRMAAELEEYQAGRVQPPEPTADGMDEAELLRLLAEEEDRARQLEQQAAVEAANWAAEAAEYAALERRVRELREDVAAMEDECSAAARQQGAKYTEQLKWFGTLAAAVSRLTGMELAGHDAAALHLSITQTIPRAMPGRELPPTAATASQAAAASSLDPGGSAAAEGGAVVLEHVLTLELEGPGSARLRGATLNPPAVEIDEDVRAARDAQAAGGAEGAAALAGLVLDVKARIRRHCRRQLLLD
ncbi:hypothetical protein TSOC_010310, partial [Tetrabaena socialis]